jgi:gamma-glutamylcyclotransferase (GGCT)/AIG2-like uncharacterized protein YtfP
MNRVAVYGTLKHGGTNAYLLESSKLVGLHRISGFKMVTNGSFPYAILSPESGTIKVEVYEVADEVLVSLNTLEGYHGEGKWRHHNHYQRKQVAIDSFDTYIYYSENAMSNLKVVESGEFDHLNRYNFKEFM